MPGLGEGVQIHTFHGNTRTFRFRLKRFSDNRPWDVAGASQIQLESQRADDGVKIAPIVLDFFAAGAVWGQGLIVATISPGDVTAQVGTYEFGVTVFIAGEEITQDQGTIEVERRAGYPFP